MSFTIKCENAYVENLVIVLKLFKIAFSIKINWGKSVAFFLRTCQTMLDWLNHYQWKWAREKN